MKYKTLFKKLIYQNRNKSDSIGIERFVPYEREFLGNTLYIHDIASFNLGFSELFESETYKFEAKRKNPLIIDCGANLGMSIIYFKKLYPDAEIIAFEADENIFSFLKKNIQSFELKNVELINKAVWNSDGVISFNAEGGAGGRIEERNDKINCKDVKTTQLKLFLKDRKIDFLKLDIEGAEYEVLKDCKKELKNIDFIFMEYHSIAGKDQNLHELLEIIKDSGFRYHIKDAFTSAKPFIKRELNYGMDLQLNVFCYRP